MLSTYNTMFNHSAHMFDCIKTGFVNSTLATNQAIPEEDAKKVFLGIGKVCSILRVINLVPGDKFKHLYWPYVPTLFCKLILYSLYAIGEISWVSFVYSCWTYSSLMNGPHMSMSTSNQASMLLFHPRWSTLCSTSKKIHKMFPMSLMWYCCCKFSQSYTMK